MTFLDQACGSIAAVKWQSDPPLYSIGTWDPELQRFTPDWRTPEWCNLTIHGLRRAMRILRGSGYYTVHRRRSADGFHGDNDSSVLITRTDGEPPASFLQRW